MIYIDCGIREGGFIVRYCLAGWGCRGATGRRGRPVRREWGLSFFGIQLGLPIKSEKLIDCDYTAFGPEPQFRGFRRSNLVTGGRKILLAIMCGLGLWP